MCGIFVFVCRKPPANREALTALLVKHAQRLHHRGPDAFTYEWVSDWCFFAFTRLSLVGLDESHDGMPLHVSGPLGAMSLVCNGMIYNYKRLAAERRYELTTSNDCEVLGHLYLDYSLKRKQDEEQWPRMLQKVRGSFAFALYDSMRDRVCIANDHMGIRPLYRGVATNGDYAFASEPVALAELCDQSIQWFSPGTYQELSAPSSHVCSVGRWWSVFDAVTAVGGGEKETGREETLEELLVQAVRRRLVGERPLACLLSGGVDSSLVSALVRKLLPADRELHTFSIGLPDSPDLAMAELVAKHIGSTHHAIVVTKAQMLAAIPEVVRAVQSYDVTTIRASVGQYLVCKAIAEHPGDFKMIFNGDCSEEIFASYAYSGFAPSDKAFSADNAKLVQDVHMFDVLRSDRCIAHFGMDARTPFADIDLVEFVMSLPASAKTFGPRGANSIEKFLLRTVAAKYLPAEVAWRPKTAFSDGVSSEAQGESWHQVLTEHFSTAPPPPPLVAYNSPVLHTREAYAYLQEYAGIFSLDAKDLLTRRDLQRISILDLVPYYWMPRFVSARDPSARTLPVSPAEEEDGGCVGATK